MRLDLLTAMNVERAARLALGIERMQDVELQLTFST